MIDFQPNPLFLTLIFVKRYVFLEVLTLLALMRGAAASGSSRWAALLAAVPAGLVAVVLVAPSLSLGDWHLAMARAVQTGGLWPIVAFSLPLAVSAFLPGVRWRWIDVLHVLLLAGYAGLWAATLV